MSTDNEVFSFSQLRRSEMFAFYSCYGASIIRGTELSTSRLREVVLRER